MCLQPSHATTAAGLNRETGTLHNQLLPPTSNCPAMSPALQSHACALTWLVPAFYPSASTLLLRPNASYPENSGPRLHASAESAAFEANGRTSTPSCLAGALGPPLEALGAGLELVWGWLCCCWNCCWGGCCGYWGWGGAYCCGGAAYWGADAWACACCCTVIQLQSADARAFRSGRAHAIGIHESKGYSNSPATVLVKVSLSAKLGTLLVSVSAVRFTAAGFLYVQSPAWQILT